MVQAILADIPGVTYNVLEKESRAECCGRGNASLHLSDLAGEVQ